MAPERTARDDKEAALLRAFDISRAPPLWRNGRVAQKGMVSAETSLAKTMAAVSAKRRT